MKLWVLNKWDYSGPWGYLYFLSEEKAMETLYQKRIDEPYSDWSWDEIQTED